MRLTVCPSCSGRSRRKANLKTWLDTLPPPKIWEDNVTCVLHRDLIMLFWYIGAVSTSQDNLIYAHRGWRCDVLCCQDPIGCRREIVRVG
jgi:hypothetical protein